MSSPRRIPSKPVRLTRQRGVSLFFALVSLVAVSLAAIVLVRSVDTSTLISGNLAFQQNATSSGDGGTEAAIAWLALIEQANTAKNVLNDPSHPFNLNDATKGYYSALDPAVSLTASSGTRFLWDDTDSKLLSTDSSGNTTRYIIQRMCATANAAIQNASCLFSGATLFNGQMNVPLPQEICVGAGCPVAGQTPQIRVTSRTVGPKNTLSYVQAFVY